VKRPSLRPLAALLLIAGNGQCALGMATFYLENGGFSLPLALPDLSGSARRTWSSFNL
jgi:hypothetical protein